MRQSNKNIENFFEGNIINGRCTKFIRQYNDKTEYSSSIFNFNVTKIAGGACKLVLENLPEEGENMHCVYSIRDISKYVLLTDSVFGKAGTFVVLNRDGYGVTNFVEIFEPKG